ncbi:MAG: hydantoinase/oxoprolinase family protein [Gemmatimonadaceae bacterium]|nr:hydantoinase/oxoprolinase family protein [Gemmatimonadaceae bacterium]MCW5826313.1 hydantoinase/oxoprolinase family protein [Gemmatimonadaceae bacterium]
MGGTFTDRAALSADGRIVAHKVLSTPNDQGEGVVNSLTGLRGVEAIVHGTTVVTNLLLERRGARVVLCATAGAEDVLELRRQDRAALYDLSRHHPAPLVSRADIVGVGERLVPEAASPVRARSASGKVATTKPAAATPGLRVERSLTSDEIARVVADVLAREPQVVLVALLHSYADASHEQAIASALRAARPSLEVVTSAEVLPEIREFERISTASAEAYARPAVRSYLERLSARLAEAGHPAASVMTSGGGMQPAQTAAQHAAALALSGPAGGVVGAAAVLGALGLQNALTIDIGGTSADAGLILGGEPLVEAGGDVAGVPIALPRVLVETVSAGGGSIAWRDDGGALRVGPHSAGARPGPVAFGLGGTEPTVTDAQLVLGRITARAMSGGITLNVEAAQKAIAALAESLGSDAQRTAEAIVAIADAEMARALRRVSVERGVDPRDCALVAFGGGGPLHACALADALQMREVIVPPFAGVLSAVGLALAPERHERAASVLRICEAIDADWLRSQLEALARGLLGPRPRDARRTPGAAQHRSFARVRYRGQGHELEVPVLTGDDGVAVAQRFAQVHQSRYGFTLDVPVEMVALRHELGEPARQATLARDPDRAGYNAEERVDDGGPAVGAVLEGPATIALPDATLFVAAGWKAEAMEIGGWRLRPVATVSDNSHQSPKAAR